MYCKERLKVILHDLKINKDKYKATKREIKALTIKKLKEGFNAKSLYTPGSVKDHIIKDFMNK